MSTAPAAPPAPPGAEAALRPARSAVADRQLDAVSALLADRSWAAVRMADVATVSGLSRQTVYNTFGTREGLAQAYVVRESAGFVEAVGDSIAANSESPVAALAAALDLFLSSAADHPLVRAISASERGDELLALVTTRGGPVVEPLTARLAELIVQTWPQAPPETAGIVADTLVRLAISHAALPGGPPERTSREVAEILGPFIERALL